MDIEKLAADARAQLGALQIDDARAWFDECDADGNGTLDREEIKDALNSLGFTFIEDKQIDKIFKKADGNGDEVIDFEEFVKETPKTLRSSLIKLAKQNGHDLGFLA